MPVVQKKARSAEAVVAEACTWGDADSLETVEAELAGADADTVDWDKMLGIAYSGKHTEVVRLIRDSGRVAEDVAKWLLWAAELGDADYMQSCINQGKDEGKNVQWDKLIAAAYGAKHEDVVRIIRDGQRVSLWLQLYFSCLIDDSDFVESIIKKGDQEEGQEKVDWKKLFETVFRYNGKISQLIIENRRIGLSDLVESMFDDDKTELVVHHTPEDINMQVRQSLTPLHIACYGLVEREKYDIKNLKAILNKGPENMLLQPGTEEEFCNEGVDVNKRGFKGRTPLHLMCHGHNDEISQIIQTNTNPNETEPRQTESQSLATTLNPGGTIKGRQMAEAITLIIERGAGVNVKDENNQTPLHLLCASKGGKDIGELLLEKGAYINQQDSERRTPLAVAVQHSNYELVSFLCRQTQCEKNKANVEGRTPLFWSAVFDDAKSTEMLLQQGVNINQADDYNVTPLAAACEEGNNQIVEILLANQADPNVADNEDRTALHKTARYRFVESCAALVGNTRVDLNAQDITGCTPLHLATSKTADDEMHPHHQMSIVTILLDAGCDVNIASNLGNIPLHNAVHSGTKDIAEKLLKHGSKIDQCNNYGQSPLIIAANSLDLKMMKCLLENRANVNLVDKMRRNLIHNVVAAFSTNTIFPGKKLKLFKSIIEWLLSQGLSVNATDLNKQTPLHLAAKDGFLQLVIFLVEKGADVTMRDSFAHMPLMSALENWEDPQIKKENIEDKAAEDAEKIEEVVKQKEKVFQYLWDITLPHITDPDFGKLQRLSYWLGHDDILEKIKNHSSVCVDLSGKPRNVQKLRHKYDLRFQKWLNSDDEKLPDFMSNWLPSLQHLTYIDHRPIKDVMWGKFLPDLQARVKKGDPFLAYKIKMCGSVDEQTKVFASDECDCSCVQENIKFEMFEEPKEEGHKVLKAFVHLECKDQHVEELKKILDSKKRLSQAKLCQYFGKRIAKVLADPEFWDQYPQLQRVTPKDISAGDRRICTMQVIWSDDMCPLLTIDIDLAPVIDLKDWKPSWCNKHPLVDEIECIALPKWKMNYKVDMDLMELGVHSWAPIFRKMPNTMRQGYRLAKVVRDRAVCPQITLKPGTVPELLTEDSHQADENVELSSASKFMNTYLLKQVIVQEFSKWDYERGEGKQPKNHSDVYWARRIYEKMEEAFEKQELNSWFIPGYNLLNDEMFVQYKDVAVMQARLCRRLLTEEAAAHFRKAYMGIHR